MTRALKRLVMAAFVGALVFLISALAIKKSWAFEEWLTSLFERAGLKSILPASFFEPGGDLLFWILLAVCFVFLGVVYFLWRCPRCSRFPGPVTGEFCKHCGARLIIEPPRDIWQAHVARMKTLETQGRAGENQGVDGNDAHSESGTGTAQTPLRDVIARLEKLDRIFAKMTRGFVSVVGILAILLSLKAGPLPAFILFLAVAGVGWLILHYVHAILHNLALLKLKCPKCGARLANHLAGFCPTCGEKIEL
jgi:hypothetical protein